jgi:hypothetical protein
MVSRRVRESNPPPHIEVKPEELRALIERVKAGTLQPGDEAIIQAMAETILYRHPWLDERATDRKVHIYQGLRL